MGLFDFAKKNKAIEELKSEVLQLKKLSAKALGFENISINNLAANINQSLALYPTLDLDQRTKIYTGTDDIYSIIRLLSTTAALIPLYGYLKTPDQKAFTQLMREQKGYKNPFKLKTIQTKALDDLPEDDPVAQLIENPHGTLSKYEFFEAVHSFLNLFGECFILKERPEDGVNQGKPIQLHLLFPQNIVIRISQELPRRIIAYDYRINGKTIQENIPAEDVIHIKYFNPEMSWLGNELRGLSPLMVLKKRLTRLDSNMDTSVAQLQNGGVPGIVFDKAFGEEQVQVIGSRKDNFYKYLSNSNNKGAPYFASGELGYIQLGMNLADLSVAELANVDFKKLCNVFGVSDILFNSDSAATESNVLIMTKRLYTNTVLPNVYRVRDALVKGLLPDFKNGISLPQPDGSIVDIKGDGKERYIDADISDITELHEDLGKRATWMQSAWWLTGNEKREMMNYDRYDDPAFDQPFIPTGLQTLQDFEVIPPIDQTTPLGN